MTDVLVYGATSAGVSAAMAAATAGASVVIVEPGYHVGGMTSGGLGYTDIGDARVLGGAAARFRAEVAAHYGVPEGRFAGPEPHVAESILASWLDRTGVDVMLGHRLLRAVVQDGTITAIVVDGPSGRRTFGAGVFVDASYEGDLLAAAGVPYAVGRESVTTNGESLAGRREVMPGRHSMPPGISPFVGSGHDGALLPQVAPGPMVAVGEGDGGVMSFGYRVCLTQSSDRIPFTEPPGYDPAHWELGRRLFARWAATGTEVAAGDLLGLERNLPNGKCDGNSIGPFSLSVLDRTAWAYPEADEPERRRIREHHRTHAAGFLWFLSSDDAVPTAVREEIRGWGLPADEFVDTHHYPHQLYVREARRMIGSYVLTQHDLAPGGRPTRQHDSVLMGSYHIDIREVQRTWRTVHEHPDPIPEVVSEGYLSVSVQPYQVPYRAMVPRYDDCRNLLVPVCLSASHVAFASFRMEPQYLMAGHAAGLAAAQAVRTDRAVQAIDTFALQERLHAEGQVLAL